jgi:hypothetical protein
MSNSHDVNSSSYRTSSIEKNFATQGFIIGYVMIVIDEQTNLQDRSRSR